jgi:DNA-binding transcriptional LysR family regulator
VADHGRLLVESTDDLLDVVRNGDGDMAVGSPPASWDGPITTLGWEEFVLVLPPGDPMLRERSVDLAGLADRRWVHFARSHGLGEVVDLQCAAAGFTPRVAVRTSQVVAAPLFAAAGLGPALVPDHIVPTAPRNSRDAPNRASSVRSSPSHAATGRPSRAPFWTPCTSTHGAGNRRGPPI